MCVAGSLLMERVMDKVKNLVVGCGLSGATIARKVAEELGEDVLIIDAKDHLAGNSYDYRNADNIMIHRYGSHIFHTSHEDVWAWVRRFASFNSYMHKVVALIDGVETTIPFNLRTLGDVFPPGLAARFEEKLLNRFAYGTQVPISEFRQQDDPDLKFLADYVYEKIFCHYTAKQWGALPDADGMSRVTARVPVRISCDERYFRDKYQGIPLEGYTELVRRMLDHPNIEVRLNTPYCKAQMPCERLFYSGSIDEYFDYCYGVLPYRSVRFEQETHAAPFYQRNAVVNYPLNYDFTRIHEFKYYLNDASDCTVIAKEYSEPFVLGRNERFYPLPHSDAAALYARYLEDAARLPHIHFLGRLGSYRYLDMDKAIHAALELFEQVFR